MNNNVKEQSIGSRSGLRSQRSVSRETLHWHVRNRSLKNICHPGMRGTLRLSGTYREPASGRWVGPGSARGLRPRLAGM